MTEPKPPRAAPGTAGALTPREIQVLRLLARGGTHDTVAADTGLACRTVRRIASSAYAKLGAENRSQAIVAACHAGLIAAPDDPAPVPEPEQPGVRISHNLAYQLEWLLGEIKDGLIADKVSEQAAAAQTQLRMFHEAARHRGTPTIPNQRTRDSRP